MLHSGKVSAEAALQKADEEFEKSRIKRSKNMVSDFDMAVKELKKKAEKEKSD